MFAVPEDAMEKSEFLRQLKRWKLQMATFDQGAREFLRSLPRLSDEAFEAYTPEAILQGTLECLLADDLAPALQKVAELEGLLKEGPER
jgi:hypothetical protein